jgi:hypothetical protein
MIRRSFLILVLFLCLLTGCHQVTLVVTEIPGNTPPGAALFISGNFNYWDPGDSRYMLKFNGDSTYTVQLPRGDGTIFCKFTRGDWHTVEGDNCGNVSSHRQIRYGNGDTVFARIASWGDLGPIRCDQVTFTLEKIPANTPAGAPVYLTGNFNRWNPGDERYRLQRSKEGRYYITLTGQSGLMEFKFTRGDWSTDEVDTYGNTISNRTFVFGKQDTVLLELNGWRDFKPTNPVMVTVVLEVPPNTPASDKIYLAGNFNDWLPKDSGLVMNKLPDGRFTLNLPRKADYIEFKFTRGDWSAVEADAAGNDIENRSFTYGRKDTLFLKVKSWRDIASLKTFR